MDKPLPDLRAVPARVYAMHGAFAIILSPPFLFGL
jgi:hypothetical protein